MPWADFILLAAVGGVLALWWLRAPQAPSTQQIAPSSRPLAMVLPATLVSEEPLPTATPQPTSTPLPSATPQPSLTLPAAPLRYKVQTGDTVAAIAQKYGSNIKDIIQTNGLSADGKLQVGQELIVPVAGPMGGPGATATPKEGALIYTVQAGDTVSAIADRYGSRIDWILAANKMQPTDFLRIGQSLLVPLSAVTATPTATIAASNETPTVTPTPGLRAPVLLNPPDAGVLTSDSSVTLTWTAVGVLAEDQWYVVTLRSGDKKTVVSTRWTKSTAWRLPAEIRGGSRSGVDFNWQVQVRAGSSEQPGAAVSPASATRRFTWR